MDRDLVGRVQHAGRRPPRSRRLPGQAQAGEGIEIDRLERQLADRREVERGNPELDAFPPCRA